MLITSTFRIYLSRSIVLSNATKQNRSLREIYVNPRVKRGKKEEKVIPSPKPTYTLVERTSTCSRAYQSFFAIPIDYNVDRRNRGSSLHEKELVTISRMYTLFEGKEWQRHGGRVS